MDNRDVILTEDGQRLSIGNEGITGADDSGPGLGRETGTTLLNEGSNIEKPERDKEDNKEQKL